MAEVGILFGMQTSIGVVNLDCSVSERHSSDCDITEFPVEVGANISDNIRKKADSLEIKGVVTNTPLTFFSPPLVQYNAVDPNNPPEVVASMQTFSPVRGTYSTDPDRVNLAYDRLLQMMTDGEMVTVVTSLRTYENMVLKSMETERGNKTGRVLSCTLSLREIITVQTQLIFSAVPAGVGNLPEVPKGKVSKKTASTGQNISALAKLTKWGT